MRFEEQILNVIASFHTGLMQDFLQAVFLFLTLLPLASRYTFTNGSGIRQIKGIKIKPLIICRIKQK